MREERRYFVYIMATASKRLYTGMTNSIRRRVREHKLKLTPGLRQSTTSPGLFTSRASKMCGTRSSAKSRLRLGLAPSGSH
jgi:predicted GIY-YIG superfamily endonuclease